MPAVGSGAGRPVQGRSMGTFWKSWAGTDGSQRSPQDRLDSAHSAHSSCSRPLLTAGVDGAFRLIRSAGCVLVFHRGFNLHFCDD